MRKLTVDRVNRLCCHRRVNQLANRPCVIGQLLRDRWRAAQCFVNAVGIATGGERSSCGVPSDHALGTLSMSCWRGLLNRLDCHSVNERDVEGGLPEHTGHSENKAHKDDGRAQRDSASQDSVANVVLRFGAGSVVQIG